MEPRLKDQPIQLIAILRFAHSWVDPFFGSTLYFSAYRGPALILNDEKRKNDESLTKYQVLSRAPRNYPSHTYVVSSVMRASARGYYGPPFASDNPDDTQLVNFPSANAQTSGGYAEVKLLIKCRTGFVHHMA